MFIRTDVGARSKLNQSTNHKPLLLLGCSVHSCEQKLAVGSDRGEMAHQSAGTARTHLAMETISACPSASTFSAVSGMLILLVVINGMSTCTAEQASNNQHLLQHASQHRDTPWLGITFCVLLFCATPHRY